MNKPPTFHEGKVDGKPYDRILTFDGNGKYFEAFFYDNGRHKRIETTNIEKDEKPIYEFEEFGVIYRFYRFTSDTKRALFLLRGR